MQTITSTQNQHVRMLRDLRQAKERQATGLYLVEGVKLCTEALRDADVAVLLVDESKTDLLPPGHERVPVVLSAPEHVVAHACEAKTPQGICAAVRMPAPLDLDMAHGAVLVLDGVQDPGNVGTMLRTAEAAGFSGMLLSPTCADVFSPKTVRATMGSVFRMPIWRGTLPEALGHLGRKGFTLVSTELGGEPIAKAARTLAQPFALIIGSEGQGVSAPVSTLCDLHVSLPMRGRAESLNAAVAAGILMYGLTDGWK